MWEKLNPVKDVRIGKGFAIFGPYEFRLEIGWPTPPQNL
jgi:hypothetical protein